MICNLLNFYRGYFHTILVFSPTIDSDEKWDWIKDQRLVAENMPLKQWIKKMARKDDENSVVQKSKPDTTFFQGLVNQDDKFDGKIPEEHFYNDYNEGEFQEIMEEQMAMIRLLKKHGEPKYLANRIAIIFDDLVGSALFSGSRGSYFKGVNTRHRHYSASFFMVSQGYKEIPKTIRTNWTALCVFEIGNEQEVKVIYEEYAMGLNYEKWLEAYRYATDGDHSFMYINFQKPKRLRMMKNLDQVIFHEDSPEESEQKRFKIAGQRPIK